MNLDSLFDMSNLTSIFPASFGIVITVLIIAGIGLIVAMYAFDGVMLRNIGRKAGLKDDWMAFVPFARTVYRLQIIGEQWWKMFFLEYIWLYAYLLRKIFGLFETQAMNNFGFVLQVLLVMAWIAYNLYYRKKFYEAFGMRGELALNVVVMPFGLFSAPIGLFTMSRVIDCIIAFSGLINYGATPEPMRLTEALGRGRSHPAAGGAALAGAPPVGVPSTGCSITGLSGMYAGQNIPMAPNDEVIIGRDASQSNIIVDQMAEKVSRKHCGIRFDSSRSVYMVTDYSSNGTFVDGGSRLAANIPQPCQRGTVLNLGSRENRFKLN